MARCIWSRIDETGSKNIAGAMVLSALRGFESLLSSSPWAEGMIGQDENGQGLCGWRAIFRQRLCRVHVKHEVVADVLCEVSSKGGYFRIDDGESVRVSRTMDIVETGRWMTLTRVVVSADIQAITTEHDLDSVHLLLLLPLL